MKKFSFPQLSSSMSVLLLDTVTLFMFFGPQLIRHVKMNFPPEIMYSKFNSFFLLIFEDILLTIIYTSAALFVFYDVFLSQKKSKPRHYSYVPFFVGSVVMLLIVIIMWSLTGKAVNVYWVYGLPKGTAFSCSTIMFLAFIGFFNRRKNKSEKVI